MILTRPLHQAIQVSIWADRVKKMIVEKHRSATKLTIEANWRILVPDEVKNAKPKKFIFEKRDFKKEHSLLKKFCYTDSLWYPDTGKRSGLTRALEVWKTTPDGRELIYQEDVERLFPSFKYIDNIMIQLGYVEKTLVNGSQALRVLPPAKKLPKFKRALEIFEEKGDIHNV